MDVLSCFDVILSKDISTYKNFFSKLVNMWRNEGENEQILILSDNPKDIQNILFNIANLYWDKDNIKVVRNIKLSNLIQFIIKMENEDTELRFLIMDLNTFKYEKIRGLRCSNVIVDINNERLENEGLPFDKNTIYQVLRPMMHLKNGGLLVLIC